MKVSTLYFRSVKINSSEPINDDAEGGKDTDDSTSNQSIEAMTNKSRKSGWVNQNSFNSRDSASEMKWNHLVVAVSLRRTVNEAERSGIPYRQCW